MLFLPCSAFGGLDMEVHCWMVIIMRTEVLLFKMLNGGNELSEVKNSVV